jgi:hypothetical protein
VGQPRAIAELAGKWWKSFRAVSLRPHLSTLVLLVPVVAVLVLLNWPGWRIADIPSLSGHRYEHGWPFTYLWRHSYTFTFNGRLSGRYHTAWELSDGMLDYSRWRLIGDVVIGIALVITAGALIEIRRRRRNSIFQFYLSELLVMITIVAIGLSFFAVRRQHCRTDCAVFASICKDEDATPDWSLDGSNWCLEGPDWLLPLLGEERYRELFSRLYAVDVSGNTSDRISQVHGLLLLRVSPKAGTKCVKVPSIETLKKIVFCAVGRDYDVELPTLPNLRELAWEQSNKGDASQRRVHGLAGLTALEGLSVSDKSFDDQAMAELEGMSHLRWLDLGGTKITSTGIGKLHAASELERLELERMHIDDSAMPTISRMRMLGHLDLSGTGVTDTGLASLSTLKELRRLDLFGTCVTSEGVRRLQASLPNCHIEWSPRTPEDKETKTEK